MSMSPDSSPRPDVVSVVAPAYNEAENLENLYERVRRSLESDGESFQLLIVDNGSDDTTLDVLRKLSAEDERVQFVSLSRNFGHQGAIIAGLEMASGNPIISMDADLQHPPEVLPEMLKHWKEGAEIVFTLKRKDRSRSLARKLVDWGFYALLSRLSGLQLESGQSDFRLLDRRALLAITGMNERPKFLRGLTKWIGYRQVTIDYDVEPRRAGRSKFNFRQLFRLGLDGVLSFSVLPLRLFTLSGVVVASGAFLYGAFVVASGVYAYISGYPERIQPGWATVATSIIFFGGIQLIGIGLLGEYLGRVYDQVKERPAYLIRERSKALRRED